MAFHLLQEGRSGARALASALDVALVSVVRCGRCRMLTEEPLCSTCSATHRDSSLLCVVESPADVVAIEQSGSYRGRYFVLMGHLSPLDGIGPEQLGVRPRISSANSLLREASVPAASPTACPSVGSWSMSMAVRWRMRWRVVRLSSESGCERDFRPDLLCAGLRAGRCRNGRYTRGNGANNNCIHECTNGAHSSCTRCHSETQRSRNRCAARSIQVVRVLRTRQRI
jgi:recombination protein RecR